MLRRGDGVSETVHAAVFVIIQIAYGALAFRSGIECLS
jgi:hypothetical protein